MSQENGDRKELQNRIVAIIGRKGSGKSTMLAERLKTADRLVVFDPLSEHCGKKRMAPKRN
jgi:ABC-type cobalamin/Fe3+-siderophores transport system ATPase subunit